MKRPVCTHDARVANRRARATAVAFGPFIARTDVVTSSRVERPHTSRATIDERASESERASERDAFGSIDLRPTDRPTERIRI